MKRHDPSRNESAGLTHRALSAIAGGARGIIINNHAQDARQIREQVHTLASLVTFVGYDEMKARLPRPRQGKPFCLLTFDDGKLINATETAPELSRLGVPAVFFLVTAWMGSGKALWFDRLRELERATGAEPPPAVAALKAMPWKERERMMDELCAACGADTDLNDPRVRVMSWEEARQLRAQGFELGSHTEHHAILPRETIEETHREIAGSIADMARHGLAPCRVFAFPNGNATRDLVDLALREGIESTMTTVPRWLGPQDRLDCLPRLYIKEQASPAYIRIKALAARTGFLLKNPNGESRRYVRTGL